MNKFYYSGAFILCLLSACVTATESKLASVKASPAMVVTANRHATAAGADVLRAGGSAVDAAIAIEAVLSLVEPQSSGLAGGAFMTYFDARARAVTVYDGRETAPASATVDMFMLPQDKPMGFIDAKTSGLSTGVPGVVSMLHLAHQDHGRVDWGRLFAPARRLATDGFAVSPRLHGLIKRFSRFIPNSTEQGPVAAYNYLHTDTGEPLPVGHILKNPDYAAALDRIAEGPAGFYSGTIAGEIVTQVSQAPRAGGMTASDLASYRAKRRQALCMPYKRLQLCGPPPPSSWLAVSAIMGLLEHAPPFSGQGGDDPLNWAIFAEAQRLAYADRDRYVADSAMVEVPVSGMLNRDYLKSRAQQISLQGAQEAVTAGDPWAYQPGQRKVAGYDAATDAAGTTHFVVVDHAGNVVSMTASVESIFGSTRMAGGMFLNNQLTDFSFRPTDAEGYPVANRAAAGKRPRSSMSPTIVLDENGEFLMATGSPGGNSIIAYTAKTLVGVLEWGLSPQQAIELPNMVARHDRVRIEKDLAAPGQVEALREFGFEVNESSGENSGLSVVVRHPDGELEGGVDPRREGVIEVVQP